MPPTFSYRPKMDKSVTLLKTGSDNIGIFVLYGTTMHRCQGGEFLEWFREDGLSAPVAEFGLLTARRVRNIRSLSSWHPASTGSCILVL
jgi:hypothetical protein